jgi:hypothetical protein
MLRSICFASVVLALAVAPGGAATIVYDFTGQPGTEVAVAPTAQVPGVMASLLARSPSLVPNAESGMDSINSNNWTSGPAADFYIFSLTPAAGSPLSLSALDYTDRRSATGPTSFQVSFSLGGSATFTPIGSYTLTDTANHRESFDLASFAALQNATTTVTFHVAGANSTNVLGTYRLGRAIGEPNQGLPANLVVTTATTAVPGPTSVILLGLGGVLGLCRAKIWTA